MINDYTTSGLAKQRADQEAGARHHAYSTRLSTSSSSPLPELHDRHPQKHAHRPGPVLLPRECQPEQALTRRGHDQGEDGRDGEEHQRAPGREAGRLVVHIRHAQIDVLRVRIPAVAPQQHAHAQQLVHAFVVDFGEALVRPVTARPGHTVPAGLLRLDAGLDVDVEELAR